MLLRKTISLSDVDLKVEGETGRFSGYASVFGGVDSYGDTIIKGAFESSLRKNGKPKMFFNHEWTMPIGKWISVKEDDHGLLVEGELTPGLGLSSDVRAAMKHGTLDGLSIGGYLNKGDYEDTEGGRVIRKWSRLMEVSPVAFPADGAARIDVSSVKSMHDIEDGLNILEKAISLHAGHMDGSVATSDASQKKMMDMMVNAYTRIAGKKPSDSMKCVGIEEIESLRDFERFLRDAGGLSKGAACALVARARKVFGVEGEPDPNAIEAKFLAELSDRLARLAA